MILSLPPNQKHKMLFPLLSTGTISSVVLTVPIIGPDDDFVLFFLLITKGQFWWPVYGDVINQNQESTRFDMPTDHKFTALKM